MEISNKEENFLNVIDEVNNIYPVIKEIENFRVDNNIIINTIIFVLSVNQSSSVLIPSNLSYLGEKIHTAPYIGINTLPELYNKGYRVFICIMNTNDILSNFNFMTQRQDCFFILGTSTSANPILTQRTIQNVYRMAVNSDNFVDVHIDLFLKINNNTGKKVILLYKTNYDYANFIVDKIYNILLPMVPSVFSSVQKIPVSNPNELNNVTPVITSDNDTITGVFLTTDFRNILYNNLVSTSLGYFVEYYSNIPFLSSSLNERYYFILYEPIFERNVKAMITDLGIENVFLPIIDCINVAKSFEKYKNLNINVIGSYGYLYFNQNKDRSFIFLTVYKYNNGWNINYNYNTTSEITPQDIKSEIYTIPL